MGVSADAYFVLSPEVLCDITRRGNTFRLICVVPAVCFFPVGVVQENPVKCDMTVQMRLLFCCKKQVPI